jgi:hypothetical protein
MATVDRNSANWRLFGGGGLLVGGLVWLLGEILTYAGQTTIGSWLEAVGVVVVGVALFFIAFGQTGSNGAVGKSVLGKAALVVYGIGWLLLGLVWLLAVAGTPIAAAGALVTIGAVLIAVGGVVSAIVVLQSGVARGAARWILFLPALWGLYVAVVLLGWVALAGLWLLLIQAALFAVTGLLYLLNRRDIG